MQILFKPERHWKNTSELLVSIGVILYLLVFCISEIITPKKQDAKMVKEHLEYDFV